jgi:diaminopimelate decarboxylase
MISQSLLKKFQGVATPFYYYDTKLLKQTVTAATKGAKKQDIELHYALKANANKKVLKLIENSGFGADCVSGNEVKRALECGFKADRIVFAGVGKSDEDIRYAIKKNIFCFNCESIEEIKVINGIAKAENKIARIALRINPNVNAHTHHYITTGLEENKFGINAWELEEAVNVIYKSKQIKLIGLHFHIGSQITDLTVFKNLCLKVNEILEWFSNRNVYIENINLGGGLGVDYYHPDKTPVPDFENYFSLFRKFLKIETKQKMHLEPGRAIVAQCGSIISRVLFVKKGMQTNFIILDAGMTELLRPALYQSYHQIENLTGAKRKEIYKYDVTGPICESSDCFRKAVELPETKRGDIMAIRTTGAYAESMSLSYNLRDTAKVYFAEDF